MASDKVTNSLYSLPSVHSCESREIRCHLGSWTVSSQKLAWENSQHFGMPLLISTWYGIWEMCKEIPYWWCITAQIWIVMHHQYGICVLVSQLSFQGETSGDIAKCWPIKNRHWFSLVIYSSDKKINSELQILIAVRVGHFWHNFVKKKDKRKITPDQDPW